MLMMADVNDVRGWLSELMSELMSELCVNDASIVVHVSFFFLPCESYKPKDGTKIGSNKKPSVWIYYLRRTDRTVR